MFCDDLLLGSNSREVDLLIPLEEFSEKKIEGRHRLFIQVDAKGPCPLDEKFLVLHLHG